MKKNILTQPIELNIITKNQQINLVKNIETILDSLFTNTKQPKEIVYSKMDVNTADLIQQIFDYNNANINDKKEAHAFLIDLKREILSYSEITLTFAIKIDLALAKRISSWIHNNLGSHMIIKIKVDSSILGGIILQYKGKIKDYSVRNILLNSKELKNYKQYFENTYDSTEI